MSTPDSSLFDIIPGRETISAGGKRHEVIGVPFATFLRVGAMWPPLLRLLGGGSVTLDEFKDAPEAIARFIAAGFGLMDDEKAIAKANSLPLIVQFDLFNGILKATLGGGAGPFSERVAKSAELMQTSPKVSDESLMPPEKKSRNGQDQNETISTHLPRP